jgi:hypothetical protein
MNQKYQALIYMCIFHEQRYGSLWRIEASILRLNSSLRKKIYQNEVQEHDITGNFSAFTVFLLADYTCCCVHLFTDCIC